MPDQFQSSLRLKLEQRSNFSSAREQSKQKIIENEVKNETDSVQEMQTDDEQLRMELIVSENIRRSLAIDLGQAKVEYDKLKAQMLAERSKYAFEVKTGRDLMVQLLERYLALKKIVKGRQTMDVATQKSENEDNRNIGDKEPRKMEALVIKQACVDVRAELTAEEPLEASGELPVYYETVKAAVFAELEALREIVRLEMDELKVQKEAFFRRQNADVKPSSMQLQALNLCVKNENPGI